MNKESQTVHSVYLPGLKEHCEVACLILNKLGKNPHTNHHVRGTIREASSKVAGQPGGNIKEKAHFMSASARQQMYEGNCKGLIGEHVVPVSIMVTKVNDLYERQGNRIELTQIIDIVKKWSILAVITTKEDIKIKARKLYHKMPPDWDGCNKYARYDAAGIKLVPNEYKMLISNCNGI
ncbi:MAG: hypothetical protein U5R49_12655 [Deltaproteobacteria bacterium]|nr:hypothetical protein [Deltaproteobacteria bacterium]